MSQTKIVAWIIGVYSILVFLMGLNFNELVNFLTPNVQSRQSLNPSKQVQIQPVVTGLLLSLIGVAGTSILENWLNLGIKQEVDKQVKEERKKFYKEFLSAYLKDYQKSLINIENKLKNANIPIDLYEEFQQIPNIEDLGNIYKLAEEIKDWLDEKENRVSLMKNVFNQIVENTSISIDKKYHNKFQKNILECLNWLCDSLEWMTPIDWDDKYQRGLTSSITGMSDIQPYKEVINLINSRLASEFSNKSQREILDYYLDELSKKYENWYANSRKK